MNASARSRSAGRGGFGANRSTPAAAEPTDERHSAARRLADGLQRILDDAELVEVSYAATTVVIEFPEADFAVTIREAGPTSMLHSTIAATVRAPAPDLSTWWTRWDLASDKSHLVAAHLNEIQAHRRRFQEMVADARRGLEVG